MTNTISLRGMGVALPTPFTADGSIDYESITRLLEYQIARGIDYVVVLGTTGESPTITDEEKQKLIDKVVDQVKNRIPVIVGIGGNSTARVVDKFKVLDFTGVSAILSVCPFYNKPSQKGLFAHFSQVAQATDLPIIVYNIPGRTGVNLKPETLLKLSETHSNIVAVKEASGNLDQISEIIHMLPSNFQVVSGDDSLTMKIIRLGGVGVISVIGNALPREYGDLVRKSLAGDYEDAYKIQSELKDLLHLMFVEGNPAGIKALLRQMGLLTDYLRLPLVPVSSEIDDAIRDNSAKFLS